MSPHVDSHWFRRRFVARPLEPVTEIPGEGLCPAAVLVPLVERPEGLQLILTRRSEHLREHAGQISFPGGRIEPYDPDPVAAALREAQEEIGLTAASCRILGELNPYDTVTGFRVFPIVAWVEPPVSFAPDPFEVEEVFEVPLDFVVDPRNHRRDSHRRGGVERSYWVLPWRERYIWGATAAMLVNLARLLGDEEDAAEQGASRDR